jgi:hypothetical protein
MFASLENHREKDFSIASSFCQSFHPNSKVILENLMWHGKYKMVKDITKT